jgi:hypothetical protein
MVNKNLKGKVVSTPLTHVSAGQIVLIVDKDEPNDQSKWTMGSIDEEILAENKRTVWALSNDRPVFINALVEACDVRCRATVGEVDITQLRRLDITRKIYGKDEKSLIKKYPLIYTQWLKSIDNGEVDSHRFIMFETITKKVEATERNPSGSYEIAKVLVGKTILSPIEIGKTLTEIITESKDANLKSAQTVSQIVSFLKENKLWNEKKSSNNLQSTPALVSSSH